MLNNSAKAILRKVRVSPQKLNVVASMIRGMKANKALGALLYSKKRIAADVRKTLISAIANAENNNGLNPDALYVKETYVGYSIKLRRFRPRGRGHSEVITKPFSHLTIVVEERV
ncbi:MAG: 50S ribosomal protein L22 [Holosporales bacterium]|jgi:large subunit ribosomal protein L22|nr:50S ribosomal protein L22 [Holosporales bacterium]